MEKVREKIINLLQNGNIPSYDYINYYDKVKNIKFKKNEILEKNINALKEYYPNASEDEKAIINNVLFILEIFNSNENALKDFLFRTLHFNLKKLKGKDIYYALEFFQKNPSALPQELFIETLKKILNPTYFFSFDLEDRKAILVNLLIIWNNPNIYLKSFWLNQIPIFKKVIDYAIKKDLIEDVLYTEFFIYHFYGNSSQTIKDWEKFNKEIEKPLSKYFKEWGERNNLPKAKKYRHKKKRIGFLIDRLVLTSPLMVEYSLWKNLLENEEFKKNYEIYLYSMNYAEKNQDEINIINSLKSLGIKVYTPQDKFKNDNPYYYHFKKAMDLREKILEDKIDVLISFFGYAIPNFLFSTRSAPKQIFWSHGNCTSEIENIDLRISHFEQECKNYEWKIINVPMAEEFLIGSEQDKIQGQNIKNALLNAFGKDTIILGIIGRLVKLDSDEYIKTIAKILKENPKTIYLACGSGNKESIEEKLEKYNVDKKRFIFTGFVNPHVYGWVIDIWPETFPLRQGQSRNEFEVKKGAIVGYKKYYSKKAIEDIEHLAKEFNIKSPLASNLDEYINITSSLIKDKRYREKVGELYSTLNKSYRKNTNFIEVIND